MKKQKKKVIVVLFTILAIGMFWFLDTDRYIRDNIITIDKADGIQIVTEEKSISHHFDEELIELVSYGGFVVKVDNYFVELVKPYSNKLTKIDMSIRYKNSGSTIANADVFQSNENPDKYILYMNNVYWTTNSKIVDLLELIE